MKNLLRYGLVLVIVSPYLFAFVPNPDDSSSTTVEMGAGFGSYADVSRDCEGNVVGVRSVPFSDVGLSVRHQTPDVRFGIAGGSTPTHRLHLFGDYPGEISKAIWFVNPTVGINYRDFGLDLGYLFPLTDYSSPGAGLSIGTVGFPTAKFRFASLHGIHWTIGFGSNLPLLTGGGLAEMALVFPLGDSRKSTLGIGLGAYPWDRMALSAKYDFPLVNQFGLGVRGQYGLGGEGAEYGLALVGRAGF